MKRNTLFVLIALGLGGVGVANAQDASSWYLAARTGMVAPDSARTTKNSAFAGIGAGVWVNPNLAVDFEYGINNADFKNNSPRFGHQWESVQLDVAARWFFGEIGSGWRPYVMGGVGVMRHKAFSGSLLSDAGYTASGGWDPMATAGVGMQYNLSDRVAFRGEIAGRYDRDNNSLNSSLAASQGFNRHSGFTDAMATVGLVVNFGGGSAPAPAPAHEEAAPPPAAPPAREEATPPPAVAIDLRGVEFKFDHPRVGEKLVPSLKAPTADSVQILDEAVDTLKRYPNVHVSVDGYTDSVGSDAYNQKLSERRAKGVYDYLTEHGVDASRLDGPKGFGESNPIDTNKTAAGRQRNRRVELKVESQ
ncbi:MAG TPA: OmpA family protein [Rudaea sp.]|jgi:OOP family OmpA-OmpF porin|nr:OmpA family protein [Rudaea sp.]